MREAANAWLPCGERIPEAAIVCLRLAALISEAANAFAMWTTFPGSSTVQRLFCQSEFIPEAANMFLPYGQRIQEVAKDCLQNEEVILDRRKVLDCGGFIREVAQPYVPNGNFFPKAAGACLPYGEETLEAAQVLHMGNLARKLQGLVCQKAKASRKRQKLACHKEKTSRPQHTLVCHMLNLIRKCQRLICQKTSGSRKRRKLVCNMVNSCRKRRRHACYPEAAKACLPLPPTGCLPQWQPSVCRFRHEFAIWQSSRVAPGMRSLYGWPLPGCVPHVAKRFRRF